MKGLVLLVSLVAAANALSLTNEWNVYKARYRKKYVDEIEDRIRMQIYIKNKYHVDQHNRRFDQGKETYTMALNKFADMSPEEFAVTMLTFNKTTAEKVLTGMEPVSFIKPFGADPPPSIDWRTLGAVTPVKDQGMCGSCWAFSTTGALEGQHYRKTKELVSLSEQNLIDCSEVNDGCQGGKMIEAYQYIMDNGGIDSESSYPYEAIKDDCQYKPEAAAATVTNYKSIKPGDEDELKIAVATVGPIAVAMDSTYLPFYKKGIYIDNQCSATELNHAVLIVGYGTEDGIDYWLVKNSWGADFGEQGYFKIIRNRNQCGIAEYCNYPLV